ncbi:response regulator [Rhodobacterales bacterium HKCCE3408]|nr:response regulator [Rhodobacterales bacterium HKCCE3408]
MRDGFTIMVIEDCEADRFFLRRAIRATMPGCEIVEFDYADDALSWLRTANRPEPEVIFVDINMPRMSGFDFVDAFEALYPELKSGANVWVMSHSIDPRDRVRAELHPAVKGFLTKTYAADDISAILGEAAARGVPG